MDIQRISGRQRCLGKLQLPRYLFLRPTDELCRIEILGTEEITHTQNSALASAPKGVTVYIGVHLLDREKCQI